MDTDLDDGVISQERASLDAQSAEQINDLMKEEQNDFAYENMDKGSNKSFDQNVDKTDGGMNLNMGQLV